MAAATGNANSKKQHENMKKKCNLLRRHGGNGFLWHCGMLKGCSLAQVSAMQRAVGQAKTA